MTSRIPKNVCRCHDELHDMLLVHAKANDKAKTYGARKKLAGFRLALWAVYDRAWFDAECERVSPASPEPVATAMPQTEAQVAAAEADFCEADVQLPERLRKPPTGPGRGLYVR